MTPTAPEAFAYLDALRASGVTNMLGAPAYLQAQYGISYKEARELFAQWAETFDPTKTPEQRAQASSSTLENNCFLFLHDGS